MLFSSTTEATNFIIFTHKKFGVPCMRPHATHTHTDAVLECSGQHLLWSHQLALCIFILTFCSTALVACISNVSLVSLLVFIVSLCSVVYTLHCASHGIQLEKTSLALTTDVQLGVRMLFYYNYNMTGCLRILDLQVEEMKKLDLKMSLYLFHKSSLSISLSYSPNPTRQWTQ